DVDQFEAAVRRGDDLAASESWQLAARAYEEAVSAYTGDFLAEDPYEEWTLLPRERLREMYRGALIGAGQCRPKVGAYQDAVAWFDRAVALDPTDEVAHRGKMRALYLAGDRSRALLAYEECRKALENEGLEPDSETVELYNAIIDGTVETEAPVVRHNLPKPATPFFGRQFEIAEILREIGDPQNRV